MALTRAGGSGGVPGPDVQQEREVDPVVVVVAQIEARSALRTASSRAAASDVLSQSRLCTAPHRPSVSVSFDVPGLRPASRSRASLRAAISFSRVSCFAL